MKKTAMAALIDLLKVNDVYKECMPFLLEIIDEVYLPMEKQQIMDAYIDRMDCTSKEEMRSILGNQYYNETYGSNSGNPNLSEMPTSSQTENKGLDWLVSHWKKLQSEGEKMNWEQIIKITELAKEVPSSQTEISDEEIEEQVKNEINYGGGSMGWIRSAWVRGAKWYREQLKCKGNG